MTKSVEKLRMLFGVGAGVLLLVVAGGSTPSAAPSSAPAASGTPGSSTAELTHASVLVTAIDRAKRTATLQSPEGEVKVVNVPEEVKGYDKLKVGDHIDIDYYESVSVAVLPAGTKPTVSESTTGGQMADGKAIARETQVSGTVLSVDAKANKLTVKGPAGNVRTVSVSDPANQRKLPSLKPGQVVQLTYTQAIAASIRPSGAK